ncbi:MAG TPA: hypothetical protein VH309_11770 [Elusimicrobiota bacterium]|jgi:hypothetical protein|nr:hypothetical protein [Elusimicrobiota bacterium]
MAASGSGKGGVGWAILAAALAVPGFLFYNWWSHLKTEREHSISAKAIQRADGGVFQTPPPSAGRLINPIASSTGAPAGAAPRTPPPSVTAAPAGMRPAGTLVAMAPAAAARPAPMPGQAAPASSAVALSTGATIVLPRDPMMSPLDLVRLQEAAQEEADRLAALAAANQPHYYRPVRHVQPKIETRLDLQGIVAKADGDNLAIINGSTVGPGESFSVPNYKGKVRVLKITSSEVTLEYNRRKFKLTVNAE